MTFELARFIKFMCTEIFPGGRLPTIELTGCAKSFRIGYIDVNQFTLEK